MIADGDNINVVKRLTSEDWQDLGLVLPRHARDPGIRCDGKKPELKIGPIVSTDLFLTARRQDGADWAQFLANIARARYRYHRAGVTAHMMRSGKTGNLATELTGSSTPLCSGDALDSAGYRHGYSDIAIWESIARLSEQTSERQAREADIYGRSGAKTLFVVSGDFDHWPAIARWLNCAPRRQAVIVGWNASTSAHYLSMLPFIPLDHAFGTDSRALIDRK